MGSGPESAPMAAALAFLVCGVWVSRWGVRESLGVGGGRKKHCAAHKSLLLIICCHSATYLLNTLVRLRRGHTHTHLQKHTSLYIRIVGGGNYWETLLFGEGCGVACERRVGQYLELNTHTQFIITSKCVLDKVFTTDIGVQISFRSRPVKWASAWQKSVASAIHGGHLSNTSMMNNLCPLYHVSYM